MIRILLYQSRDAAKKITEILEANEQMRLCGCFSNFNSLRREIHLRQPDVVLMDSMSGTRGGMEELIWIKRQFPMVKVLILTDKIDRESIMHSIRLGADGYIVRTTIDHKIENDILDVVGGGIPLSPFIIRALLDSYFHQNAAANYTLLTEREREVLHLLVEGMTYKLVAFSLNIAVDTVRSHIRNIYEKLNVSSKAQAVAKALKERIVVPG